LRTSVPAAGHAGADQLLEVGRDLRADAEWRTVGDRLDLAHHEILVDGEPQPHVVNRLARHDLAAKFVLEAIGLDVGQVAFDVPEAVGTPITLKINPAAVQVLAFGGGRKGHIGSQAEVSGGAL